MNDISPSFREAKKPKKCKPGHELYTVPSRQMAAKIGNLPSTEASSSTYEKFEIVTKNSSRPLNLKSPSNIDDKRSDNEGKSNGAVPKVASVEKNKQKNIQKREKESILKKQEMHIDAQNLPKEVKKSENIRRPRTASKTQEFLPKNAAAAKQPPQSHGFENLSSGNGPKARAPKWKPRNRQAPPILEEAAKKISSSMTLDDESSGSANNTFNDLVLTKGFTVENSNLKTPLPDSASKIIPTSIILPPPPKKYSSNVEMAREKVEKLKIFDNETSRSTTLEKKIVLSPIFNAQADISWPEIMENEEKGKESREKTINAARILEGPGIIKITNEMAAVFNDNSMTKKSKGRGFQYSDGSIASEIKLPAPSYNVLDQKAAGRAKYLKRDGPFYAPPGGRRISANENDDDDKRRFQPQNLFLQTSNVAPVPPPPAKFSTIQEKSFTAQNLDPIDQMFAGMKLLLDRRDSISINIDHIMAMRRAIQEKYEKVVQMDYNANFKYGIERKMWKSAFYDIIEFLRTYTSEVKSTGLIELCRESLRNLIDEGIRCYDKLLNRSLSAYQVSLQDFLFDFDENLHPQMKIRKSVQDLQSAQKYVLYTCHKFKISLGDLERYKQQIDAENHKNGEETCDYSAARKHYSEATQMLPGYGRPYNQLALLAQYTNRRLDTVYYFFRSLSVKHPFLSATESMKCTFDLMKQRVDSHRKSLKTDNAERSELENRENITKSHRNEIWIDPESCSEKPWPVSSRANQNDVDVESDEVFDRNSFKDVATQVLHKQFVVYFLALHGMIFGKIDLDKFEEFAVYNLKQMREILSRGQTPFTTFSLVQIAFVCLFNIEEAGGQANIKNLPKDQCPARFQHAVKLALSIFGLLIEKLHELWISGDKSVKLLIGDPLSDVLLPAIRIFCSYLSSPEAYQCYSNSVRITLPEDDLCFPIKNVAKLSDVGVTRSPDEPFQILANKVRLNSLVELLELWDAQETNKIYLPIKIEDRKFMVVDREQLGDIPPETIFRRRSAASQSENDHSDFLNNSDNSHDISAETLAFRTNQKDEEAKNALREKEQKTGVVLLVEPLFLAPDTNTFIDHLDVIEKLILHSKVFKLRVPLIVVDELKGLTKDSENKWKAQQSKESLEFLRRMEDDHSRKSGTVEYITVRGSSLDSQGYSHEDATTNATNDDRILTSCIKFLSSNNTKRKSVDISIEPIELRKTLVLLTGDRNLRVKAISKEVPVRTIGEFVSWVESKPPKK